MQIRVWISLDLPEQCNQQEMENSIHPFQHVSPTLLWAQPISRQAPYGVFSPLLTPALCAHALSSSTSYEDSHSVYGCHARSLQRVLSTPTHLVLGTTDCWGSESLLRLLTWWMASCKVHYLPDPRTRMLAALYTSELLQHQSHNQEGSIMAGFTSSMLFPILTEIMGKEKKEM